LKDLSSITPSFFILDLIEGEEMRNIDPFNDWMGDF